MGYSPIDDYALLSDCRGAALVSKGGSIDWLCWPRFESDALFAGLLDDEKGGRWRVAPREGTARRRYLDESNALATRWAGSGVADVYDFMPVGRFEGLMPEHAVIRLFRCEAGEITFHNELLAKGNYGQDSIAWTSLRHCLRAHHGNFQYSLQTFGGGVENVGDRLVGSFQLKAGERAGMILTANRDGPAVLFTERQLWKLLDATVAEWRAWAAKCTYHGPYRDAVVRSALALKAMCFAPSGAVIAAPSASLPESPGGALNWDYRYCWLRDASHTTRALWELGFHEESDAFVSWLLHATTLSRPKLRVLYDVFGRRPRPEFEAGWLRGYEGARPVRIGNAAESQHQLDLYGEVIDAAYQQIVHRQAVDRTTATLLLELAEYAAAHWRETDAGIWEYRDELRHHTHSKILCWVAADRAARLQDEGWLPRGQVDLHQVRHDIAQFLHEAAVEAGHVLTAAAGAQELDASVLLASSFGFFSPNHPVMLRTFAQLRERLGADDSLLYRAERFVGREGAFLFCSFWAVEYLAMRGDHDEAGRWLDLLLQYKNDVGLFAEEADVETGRALGNFPQAFSHVGLINAALALLRGTARVACEPFPNLRKKGRAAA